MPLVSVVMPVFNGERFLAAAIESILAQTFTDFEFIIVDDGSHDRSPEIANSYAAGDDRIRVIQLYANKGISSARNNAIAVARGKYFASMDSDDVSLPQRLQKQVYLLENQPKIDAVGTHALAVDSDLNDMYDLKPPAEHARIVWEKCMGTPFVHTSLMMRLRSIIAVGGYDETMRYSQDADLITRFLGRARFANIAERLLLYRLHSGQQTSNDNPKRRHDVRVMKTRFFERLFGEAPADLIQRYDEIKFSRRMNWWSRRSAKRDIICLLDAIDSTNWVEQSEAQLLVAEMNRFLEGQLPRRVQRFLHWRRHHFGRL